MRARRLPGVLPLALLVGSLPGLLLISAPAAAQVTVNPGALDLLPSARPAAPAPHSGARTPVRPSARAPARPARPEASSPAAPAPAAPSSAAKPALPAVPPAIAALPPPVPVPAPRVQAAPVVPVAPDAPGTASPILGGVRVTFGKDRQELNPATLAALQALAQSLRVNDRVSINVFAYASGSADDPSTARRLSLERALAARGVLITEGIPSTRIYPRALGAAGGDADPDRVDVVAGTPGPPSAAPPVQPAAAPASAPAAAPAASPAPAAAPGAPAK